MNRNHITGSVLVLLALAIVAIAQDKACDSYDKSVKYEILSDDITVKNSHSEIFLEIYVKNDRFNAGSMIRLAQRLRTEYCRFDLISVRFFDTRKLDRMPDPPPHPLYKWESDTPMRGFYEQDRKGGRHELSFLEKRGSKTFTVDIEFNERGHCVSEEIYQPETRTAVKDRSRIF